MIASQRPAYLIEEPASVYHSRATRYLSSHQLGNFRKCPHLYYLQKMGQLPQGESAAYLFGRAAHTLILEGRETFEREYTFCGPINPKTGKPFGPSTNAAIEWAAENAITILPEHFAGTLERMEQAVLVHPEAASLITDGFAEGVVRAEYCGTPCQIRMDYYSEQNGIVDLKTCDDLDRFESDAKRYGYLHQLAFYREVLRAVTDRTATIHIVAVEKKLPYRCGVWKLATGALNAAQCENETAIDQLKKCSNSGLWSTSYEQTRVLDFA